jgi:NTE family protein
LIEAYQAGSHKGTYWGIRTDIADYSVPALPCPVERTLALAEVPTRLSGLDDLTQERLINWGYAVSDAALRAWVDRTLSPATGFPYPGSAV